jgi:hypothetical protein
MKNTFFINKLIFMTLLIYVNIDKINNHTKNILNYLYYKLIFMLSDNNIEYCNLYFSSNNYYYDNLHISKVYDYLMRNTFYYKKYNNPKNIINTQIILINDKIYFDYLSEIIEKTNNIVLLNLKTPRNIIKNQNVIKYNELSINLINYFTTKYIIKDHNLNNNFEHNDYPFDKYIYKQHYNYHIKYELFCHYDNITIKNIKNNKKNNILTNNLNKHTKYNDNEIKDYFESSLSLSTYVDEIEDNSFMGIMISCEKNIFKLLFIPDLIYTNFVNEIISFNDYTDLIENELNNNTIKYEYLVMNNLNSENKQVNGLIPLYINKQHFDSIYRNLKKYMGIMFTGNDYGYDKRQYRIFYKILIDYVYSFYNKKLNDKEIILFLNYYRFCCELSKINGYVKGINNYINKLNETYLNTPNAVQYLIGELITLGNIEQVETFISKIQGEYDTEYVVIIPKIMKQIIAHFGSWTKFLNSFDTNNGYFEDVSFINLSL